MSSNEVVKTGTEAKNLVRVHEITGSNLRKEMLQTYEGLVVSMGATFLSVAIGAAWGIIGALIGGIIGVGAITAITFGEMARDLKDKVVKDLDALARTGDRALVGKEFYYDYAVGLNKGYTTPMLSTFSLFMRQLTGKCGSIVLSETPFYDVDKRSNEYQEHLEMAGHHNSKYGRSLMSEPLHNRSLKAFAEQGTVQNRLVIRKGSVTLESEVIPNAGKVFDDMLESANAMINK